MKNIAASEYNKIRGSLCFDCDTVVALGLLDGSLVPALVLASDFVFQERDRDVSNVRSGERGGVLALVGNALAHPNHRVNQDVSSSAEAAAIPAQPNNHHRREERRSESEKIFLEKGNLPSMETPGAYMLLNAPLTWSSVTPARAKWPPLSNSTKVALLPSSSPPLRSP